MGGRSCRSAVVALPRLIRILSCWGSPVRRSFSQASPKSEPWAPASEQDSRRPLLRRSRATLQLTPFARVRLSRAAPKTRALASLGSRRRCWPPSTALHLAALGFRASRLRIHMDAGGFSFSLLGGAPRPTKDSVGLWGFSVSMSLVPRLCHSLMLSIPFSAYSPSSPPACDARQNRSLPHLSQ